jgi:predicted phosphodiesterase
VVRTIPAVLALTVLSCGAPLQQVQLYETGADRAAAVAEAARESALPVEDNSVKFGVIGDTGTGDSAQYDVGLRLAEAWSRFPFEFVIMLGDNLYGSEGPSAYVAKFERPYQPLLDAGVQFYASLGNHDEPAQRFYEPFNMGGKRYYTFRKGDVEFFVLDSTYMGPEQLEWLEDALSGSNAPWKIAYMHHPMYSSGEKHGSEVDLQILVEPLFLEHGVDVVFSGHEHFYERLVPQKGIQYITQGASAKLRSGNIRRNSPMTASGFDTDRSFTLIEVVDDHMFVETVSRRGEIVDSAIVPRREIMAQPVEATE